VIDEFVRGIDAVVDADPDALADSDTIVELHRQLARLEAAASRAAARWDAKQTWSVDGAKSGGAWLAAKLHVPRQEANRRLRLGRALRHLPHAEQAWLAGSIGSAQVSALAASRTTDRLAEQMAVDEQDLVDEATRLSFRRFQCRLDYWRQQHDIDSEDSKQRKQVDGRFLHLSQTFQNTWRLDANLDPIAGTILHDTLARIERELFERDWADAKQKLGREPLAAELERTPAQRRADALIEMATRARTAPANGRRPEPLFTVLIGLPRFEQLCELANSTVITPGSLVGWFSHAWIERVVFQPPSRVIDVGERRRLFEGATRRAVEVRDLNQCFHDLCEDPIEQIDHIQPHSWDGPTTQDNGRGACAFHNRQRHRRGPPEQAA
jgi:hypothetical protein